MDTDIARHVLRAAFRSASELQQLLPVLKRSCESDEYDAYAKAIASAVAEIGLEITNRVLGDHPALEAEVESHVSRHGRYI